MALENSYICRKATKMIIAIKKRMGKTRFNELLRKFKRSKKLDARRHLGKVKWNEDALRYQKRIRGEWD